MDFKRNVQSQDLAPLLHQTAKKYEKDMIRFARDLIATPGFSASEGRVVSRVAKEMKKAGFEKIRVDRLGNIIGQIGKGRVKIMYDAHLDTVGVGDRNSWKWDPFKGKFEGGVIYGRGATDQKLSMVSMVYAGKMIKDLGIRGDFSYWAVGSCMEEDCDGLPLLYLIKKEKMKPDYVVITEPTNMTLCRGHRGRMEMKIVCKGKSCHASAPERGVNAVGNMSFIIQEIAQLNERLTQDDFLGKGTVAVTKIECQTPSLNAVPDECTAYLDRRLTTGETKESALKEIESLSSVRKYKAGVHVLQYEAISWKGLKVGQEKYYPTWVMAEDHPLVQAGVQAARIALGEEPKISKWVFSTNGVATAGCLGIPTIGFGPSNEIYAHTVNEQVSVDHLLKAAVFYATLPQFLLGNVRN